MSTRHVSVQMYPVPNLPSSSTQRFNGWPNLCTLHAVNRLPGQPAIFRTRKIEIGIPKPRKCHVMYVCMHAYYIYDMTHDICHMSNYIIYDICQIPGVVHGN